jgi:hypothetical protein
MRSAPWCALLCGAVVHTASAQGTPVTFEEPQPVSISGFGVATADYNRDARANSFAAGKLAVAFFKPVGDAYFFGQLTTAMENGATTTEIDNLIVSWTPGGATRWTIAAGRFDAPIGFERDDEPLNLIATSSFNFEFARPSKLTGAIVRYAASPKVEVAAGLANGWDAPEDNNRGKTGLVRAQWIAASGVTLGVTGIYGPEHDSTDALQRGLVSTDLTVERGPAIVGVEVNLGSQRDGMGGSASWTGAVATAFCRLGSRVGISARYDHLDDSRGVASGAPQVLRSFTIGPMWFYRSAQAGIFSNIEHTTFHLPQIAVRAALRVDYSTQPFFPTSDGGLDQRDTHVVVELLYLF